MNKILLLACVAAIAVPLASASAWMHAGGWGGHGAWSASDARGGHASGTGTGTWSATGARGGTASGSDGTWSRGGSRWNLSESGRGRCRRDRRSRTDVARTQIVQLLQKKVQLKLLASAFSVYGLAVAVFALVQSFTSSEEIYWFRTPRQGGSIYGPYVNRSHYAGLMEMLVPIPLVLSLSRFPEEKQRNLARVAAVLMASTIFLSKSRGGMVAFVVQMAVLGIVLAREKKGRTAATSLGIFLVLVAGMLIWLGGSELNQRLISIHSETNSEIAGGTRLDA